MEEQWYVDRARLRELRQQHPAWTYAQLAEELEYSLSWVKKWCKRFDQADPNDDTVLRGLPRRRKNPPPAIEQAVVKRILEIRDHPPEGLNRTPGPETIKYYLHRDKTLRQNGTYLPRSGCTIWKILNRHQRIVRPKKPEHTPLPRAEPMAAWQIDFKDVTTVPPEPEGKRSHTVEVLNVVDSGTSILVDNPVHADYNAETAIETLTHTFRRWGCPQQITFDRDPRFVGSWSGRGFPTAFVRFLLCLNIKVDICPPQRPDRNPFVERYHRTYEYEGIRIYRPTTEAEVVEMNAHFAYHYNYHRPNQAITCGNQPPRSAFPQLPQLPALPDLIDPDRWLHYIDQKCFKRRVNNSGVVKIDKHRYYIGRSHHGRYVVLKVDAKNKQFLVQLNGKLIKQVPIKGLHDQIMPLEDYLKFIQAQAFSEWRRYKLNVKRYTRVTM